jgi:hypothetical protein
MFTAGPHQEASGRQSTQVPGTSAQILRVSSSLQSVPQCAPDLQVHNHHGHLLAQFFVRTGEIGRASCRERVLHTV